MVEDVDADNSSSRVRWVVEKVRVSAGACQSNVFVKRNNTGARARQAPTTCLHLHSDLASLLQPSRTNNMFYPHASESFVACMALHANSEKTLRTCSRYHRYSHLQNIIVRPQEPNYQVSGVSEVQPETVSPPPAGMVSDYALRCDSTPPDDDGTRPSSKLIVDFTKRKYR